MRLANQDVAMIDTVGVPDHASLEINLAVADDHLLSVADGLGGHAAGELASALAVRHLAVSWRRDRRALVLPNALRAANRAVYDCMTGRPEHRGMGSTLAGVHLIGQTAHWFSIGDSRVYLFRAATLRQLSPDHVTGEGDIYPPGLLTQCLGGAPTFVEIEPAFGSERLVEQDTILVCTDGVSGVLTDGQIALACAASSVAQMSVELRSAVRACGAPDNFAYIALRSTGTL